MAHQILESVFGMVGFVAILYPIAYGLIWMLDKIEDRYFDIWGD